MKSIIATQVQNLRQLDPHIWKIGTKIGPIVPRASKLPVSTANGSLYYRSVYYYSDNIEMPYVRLVKKKDHPLPIVTCCSQSLYDKFLIQVSKGFFPELSVKVPISYYEQVSDL